MGFIFQIGRHEWLALVIVIGVVFLAELFNSAIEKLADVIDPEWNDKIGVVKDLAAGAVLVSAVVSVVVGAIIFLPEIAGIW